MSWLMHAQGCLLVNFFYSVIVKDHLLSNPGQVFSRHKEMHAMHIDIPACILKIPCLKARLKDFLRHFGRFPDMIFVMPYHAIEKMVHHALHVLGAEMLYESQTDLGTLITFLNIAGNFAQDYAKSTKDVRCKIGVSVTEGQLEFLKNDRREELST